MSTDFPQVVVTSRSRRAAPLLRLAEDPRRRPREAWQPVGVRHAVPSGGDRQRVPQTLCGEPLSGWYLFPYDEFTGGAGADCRRCLQVVRSAQQPAAHRRMPAQEKSA